MHHVRVDLTTALRGDGEEGEVVDAQTGCQTADTADDEAREA